ncbi:unnamed protein product [Urochloa humidicola]
MDGLARSGSLACSSLSDGQTRRSEELGRGATPKTMEILGPSPPLLAPAHASAAIAATRSTTTASRGEVTEEDP